MKVRRIQILLIALVSGISLTSCIGSESSQDVNPSKGRIEHFTTHDLERLGCKVDVSPRTTTQTLPFGGTAHGYGYSKGPSCASELTSIVQESEEYDEGIWLGHRASAMGFARRNGYELESYSANIGEHSEIEVFIKNGEQKGFKYSVQANGYLRSVDIISDTISPGDEFEAIMKEKF